MSVDVQAEVLINKDRETVGGFMFDPKCDMIWMNGLTKVFPLTAGNFEKGSKVEHVGSFLGRHFSRIAQVTRDEPNRSLEFVGDEPFQMKIKYELSDSGDSTKVKICVQSVAEVDFPMPASTVANAMKEKIVSDLKKLKKHLENGE